MSGAQTQSEKQRLFFLKEGRGSGDGREYVPGRALRDMGGLGRLHRFACTRCGGRQIVLPSDMALSVFLEEHWDPATSELKEHYPSLDVDQTTRIARTLGVRHPTLKDGSPAILITDLVVCKQTAGGHRQHAIDVASSRSSPRARLSASRAIKQEYWRRLGVPYRIETSDGLNRQRAVHLWDLFNIAEQVLNFGLTKEQRGAQRAILDRFKLGKEATLIELCHATARTRGISRADCVAALRRLIAMRLIECSLDVSVLLAQPRCGVRICAANKEGKSEFAPPLLARGCARNGTSPGVFDRWKRVFCR